MKTVLGKSVLTITLLLVFLVALLPGCESAPSLPVQVELSFSEPPVLGKPVEVAATFNLVSRVREIAHDVRAEIILSEGFELVDGDTEWKGDFIRGQSYTISATIKAVKTGIWKIVAEANYSPGEGAYEGGFTALYVTVTEESATISDRPPHEVPTPVQTDPPAGYPAPTTPSSTPSVSAPSMPIKVQLSFSDPPILDKPVQVTAAFNLEIDYQDAPNITTRIILSEGFELVYGDTEWNGDFIRGQSYTISATVKAVKTGT